jgi:CheY-like chemotaxis protein
MRVGEMRCAPAQIRPLVHANRSWANVDIGLPGMNGYELAVKMREARPVRRFASSP